MAVYDPDYHPIEAQERLSVDGFVDDELAQHFGISRSTLYAWKQKHPEFREACILGKRPANKRVEAAILKRALGYDVPYEITENGVGANGPINKVKRGVTHVPGDVTAQMFWLKNREPERWKDKQELQHTGKDGGPIEISSLTPEERKRRIDELIAKRGN